MSGSHMPAGVYAFVFDIDERVTIRETGITGTIRELTVNKDRSFEDGVAYHDKTGRHAFDWYRGDDLNKPKGK